MKELTMERFEEATEIVSQVTNETKLLYSPYFSQMIGNKVYLKPENMQTTGSYKIRGSYYKISTLPKEQREKGLIAASAGNHAQGVAYAAMHFGCKATIVMPQNTPLLKVNRTKEYGDLHSMYKKTRSEGFGSEVKRRIMLGSFVLSSGYYDAYYLKALKTKALIKQEFDKAFEKYDIILAPAAPTTAPLLGSSLQDPIKMYLSDIYTISANLAGIPGLSIPCGKDNKGLPIGMQLLGGCFQEKTLLRAGFAYEKAREEEA